MALAAMVLLAVFAAIRGGLARAAKHHGLAEHATSRAAHKRLEDNIAKLSTAVPHIDNLPLLRICNGYDRLEEMGVCVVRHGLHRPTSRGCCIQMPHCLGARWGMAGIDAKINLNHWVEFIGENWVPIGIDLVALTCLGSLAGPPKPPNPPALAVRLLYLVHCVARRRVGGGTPRVAHTGETTGRGKQGGVVHKAAQVSGMP